MLTIGSLFSGIGGLELGLERAGMRTVWQVEMDDYASKILERHWPDALRFRDVREVGSHNLPPVDLICGGFPCQDISFAGKGAGIAGERSGLWSEFARIVRELRPRYVVVENVAALLARGLGVVLGDLAACGYDAEWDCIPAAAVGAHHLRDRIFIVAYAHGDALWEQQVSDLGRSGAAVAAFDGADRALADAASERLDERLQLVGAPAKEPLPSDPRSHPHPYRERLSERAKRDGEAEAGRSVFAGRDAGGLRDAASELRSTFQRNREGEGIWATEPDVGRVAHGVPARVDRLRCLGNAVVPQVAEFIGRRIVAMEEACAAS